MAFRRFNRGVAALVFLALSGCVFGDYEPSLPDDAVQSYRGVWIGKSLHPTVGAVSVHRADDDLLIMIEDNFQMPLVPGTIVALGRDGYSQGAVIGELRRATGRSLYLVPDKLRISDYNEIWLWDATGNRPLGVARLRGV